MTCGKIFYPSRKLAKKDMKRINTVMERGLPRLTGVYYCTACQGYHTTTQPKSRRDKSHLTNT